MAKKLVILYKKNPDSTVALAKVTQQIGFATSTVVTGSIEVTPESEVGASVDLPDNCVVSTRISTTEDGKAFNWIVLN
jgi:hypothetical protein